MRLAKYMLLGCIVAAAACSPKPEHGKASDSAALQPESAHASGAPAVKSNKGLKFTPSPDWISEPPSSSSRQAQYKLPRLAGDPEDAELVVYFFGGGGGTPQANVERWIGQFSSPDGKPVSDAAKTTHKTVNGLHVTIVDVRGTYTGSMGPMQPGGRPKSGFRMLGAIAEAGNGPWFVKLTGPERTVTRWEPTFRSFLDSMQQGN